MVFVVIALAGFVQGATGLGFTLVAVPLGAVSLPGGEVIGTVARTAVAVDLALVLLDGRTIDVPGIRCYAPAALVGIAPGLIAVSIAPANLLLSMAALVAVGGGLLLWIRMPPRPGGHRSAAGAGTLAGFFGVTTGLSGPPLAVHSALAGRPARSHRATLAILFLGIDLVAAAAHRDTVGWPMTIGLAVFALAGLAAGRLVGDRSSPMLGRRAVGSVAVASGVAALVALA